MLPVRVSLPRLKIGRSVLRTVATGVVLQLMIEGAVGNPLSGGERSGEDFPLRSDLVKNYYEERKTIGEAINSYEKLIIEQPYDCKLRVELARAREMMAQVHLNLSRDQWPPIQPGEVPKLFEQALSDQVIAFKMCPDDAEVRNRLAQLYYATKKFEDAIKLLEEDLWKDPNDTDKLRMLAQAEARVGKDIHAARDYERLLSLDPSDGTARLRLAQILRRLGASGEADFQMDEYRRTVGVDIDLRDRRDLEIESMRLLSTRLGIRELWDNYSTHLKEGKYEDALANLYLAKGRLAPLTGDEIWGDAASGLLVRTDAFIRNVRQQMED